MIGGYCPPSEKISIIGIQCGSCLGSFLPNLSQRSLYAFHASLLKCFKDDRGFHFQRGFLSLPYVEIAIPGSGSRRHFNTDPEIWPIPGSRKKTFFFLHPKKEIEALHESCSKFKLCIILCDIKQSTYVFGTPSPVSAVHNRPCR